MAGETKLINKRAVANRYGGCALRTVQRWVQAGVLPPPDVVINGRGYWNEARLDEHDRQRVIDAGRHLTKTPSPSTPERCAP